MKKNIMLVLISVLLLVPFGAKADAAEIEKQQKAVIAMAEAYLNQGAQVQYDSYRKQLLATPEDATSQHIVYTVCSGITYQAYYQALGIDIPDTTDQLLAYARDNIGTSYVVDYYDRDDLDALGATNTEIGQVVFDKWLPVIQPGDIIVQTGHAMLVHSVDVTNRNVKLLEAAIGDRYDLLNHKDVVDSTNTLVYRQLENKIAAVVGKDELALIRPTKDGNKYLKQGGSSSDYTYTEVSYSGVTKAGEARMKYAGIDIEKTINIKDGTNQQLLVGLGEEIEYTIVISNKGTSNFGELKLVEKIPSFLELKDNGSGALNGNELSWNITSIDVGETVTFKYSVKVPNDNKLLGKTFSSTGNVSDISTTRIDTIIGTKYSSDNINKLRLAYDDVVNNESAERKFINDLYMKAFNLDLGLSDLSNTDILEYDASISSTGLDTLAVKRTKIKDSAVAKYIYQNFYGLRIFDGVSKTVNSNRDCPEQYLVRAILHWNVFAENELNDRARNLNPTMLLDGDIILMYTTDTPMVDDSTKCPSETLEDRAYIYLNNKLIRKKAVGDIETIEGDALTTFLNDLVGEHYVLLRPSNERKKVEEVDSKDTFMNYNIPIIGLICLLGGVGIGFAATGNKKKQLEG